MKIALGDWLRTLKLPGWARAILNLTKGQSVKVGGHDVLLDQRPGATPPRTGLDQAHKPGPPQSFGHRR